MALAPGAWIATDAAGTVNVPVNVPVAVAPLTAPTYVAVAVGWLPDFGAVELLHDMSPAMSSGTVNSGDTRDTGVAS